MPSKSEGKYAGEFLASEANGELSREKITVLSGSKANPGDVLGKITLGAATSAAFAGNTGNGVMGAVTVSQGAKPGIYRLVVMDPVANAGAFYVEDPDGKFVATGKVGTAFSAGGLAFTLADGATDFISGDGFNITVAVGSGKYVPIDATGTDGRQTAAGIAYGLIDATNADAIGVAIVRHAEVNGAELGYGSLDAGHITQANADLLTLRIIVRTGV